MCKKEDNNYWRLPFLATIGFLIGRFLPNLIDRIIEYLNYINIFLNL